jgi:hypothetical protein
LHYAIGELGIAPDSFYFMSFAEYQSIAYGYQMRQSKEENLFRTLWVQLNNVNVTKKGDLIRKPEKYWKIPLIDAKPIVIPTAEEKAKAYEIGLTWQNLKFEEQASFDTITNKIQ